MTNHPPAPYTAETRAKGWRFELDLEQIAQSDTWALASPDLRPWLLMLWSISWQQVPCGSLPNDDDIIAARIGMKPAAFKKARAVLLRGWQEHEDGRLYHPTVTRRVLAMLEVKQKEKDRKAAYRAKMAGNVPRDTYGTDTGQPPDDHGSDPGRDATSTGTGTSTGSKPTTLSGVVPGEPESREQAAENATRKGELSKRLRVMGIEAAPHLVAWAEILPAYSDAEILAVAESAREKKPGERIHLNYLLPMLRDRAAPKDGKPGQKFDPVAHVNRNRKGNGNASCDGNVIEGTARHVAGA